jgi:predicted ABC-class ATPase
LNGVARQFVGVDDGGAEVSEDSRDLGLPAGNVSRQADQEHVSGAMSIGAAIQERLWSGLSLIVNVTAR